MKEIQNIFIELENRRITLADAKRQLVKLFEDIKPNLEESGGNLEQWVINNNQEEVEDLRRFRQEYFDFWEWYEDAYGRTEKELWDEFEQHKQ